MVVDINNIVCSRLLIEDKNRNVFSAKAWYDKTKKCFIFIVIDTLDIKDILGEDINVLGIRMTLYKEEICGLYDVDGDDVIKLEYRSVKYDI